MPQCQAGLSAGEVQICPALLVVCAVNFKRFLLPCRGEVPLKMSAGHFCCVYEDELWVFPGPGNVAMRRVHCLNLQTYRWGL